MKKIKIISIIAATVLVLGAAATTVAVLVNRDDVIRLTELKINLLDSPMGVPKEDLSFSWVIE